MRHKTLRPQKSLPSINRWNAKEQREEAFEKEELFFLAFRFYLLRRDEANQTTVRAKKSYDSYVCYENDTPALLTRALPFVEKKQGSRVETRMKSIEYSLPTRSSRLNKQLGESKGTNPIT